MEYSLDFPRLFGEPSCSGIIRQQPEDFQVFEHLGFEPQGQGEHVYLHIRKRGENTLWLAKQIARLAGVKLKDVGYAGLKDRHAVTEQWFSVWLPGKSEPDWNSLASESVNILNVSRHNRKLKRGIHQGNRFVITLRGLSSSDSLATRLQQMREHGVPNYFGEQRFGISGGNLEKASALFRGELRIKDRHQRGLYLSAVRSYLFNEVVAERIHRQCFNSYLSGDRLIISGTSNLSRETDSTILDQAVKNLQLHPTAPLYGAGRELVEAESLAMEADILARYPQWCQGLEKAGLKRERRAVRVSLGSLDWQIDDAEKTLQLCFDLPSGCFATSVIRECCDYRQASETGLST